MQNAASSPILVISPRWQTRALLVAQIGEMSDRDVISAPGIDEALRLIKLGGLDPVVLVVDAGQHMRAQDVERLVEARRDTPLVLVVSRLRQAGFRPLRARCAAMLVRPVSVGRIAETVIGLLSDPAR